MTRLPFVIFCIVHCLRGDLFGIREIPGVLGVAAYMHGMVWRRLWALHVAGCHLWVASCIEMART